MVRLAAAFQALARGPGHAKGLACSELSTLRLQMALACLQQRRDLIGARQLAEARHALLHQAQHIVLVRRLEQLNHLRSKHVVLVCSLAPLNHPHSENAALASAAVDLQALNTYTGKCHHESSMLPGVQQLTESWLARQLTPTVS